MSALQKLTRLILCALPHEGFGWLSKPAEALSEPLGSTSPDLRVLEGRKICQCPFAEGTYGPALEPSLKATPDNYGSIVPNSLASESECHTACASTLRLWDDLHRPHQLGLMHWPNQTLEAWIFYGP